MFFRKVIPVCMLIMALLLSSTVMAEAVDASNVMEKIVEANTAEALLQNHESIYVQFNGIESYTHSVLTHTESYVDHDLTFYDDWSGMPEIQLADGATYAMYNDSLFGKAVDLGGTHDLPGSRDLILMPASATETVLNVKTVNGSLIVDTELTGDQLRGFDSLVDADVAKAQFVYCADPETLELYRTETVYFYDDGTVRCGMTEISYDIDRPELVQQIYEHAQLTDTRTITVVMDPGTDEEQTITSIVAKGDYIFTQFYEPYATLYDDPECTIEHASTADSTVDMILYTKKEQ